MSVQPLRRQRSASDDCPPPRRRPDLPPPVRMQLFPSPLGVPGAAAPCIHDSRTPSSGPWCGGRPAAPAPGPGGAPPPPRRRTGGVMGALLVEGRGTKLQPARAPGVEGEGGEVHARHPPADLLVPADPLVVV